MALYVRPEWKPDEDGLCDGCSMAFGVVKRRHHCRRCGGVYCSGCSSEKRLLPTLGYTGPQRVCGRCSGLPLMVCGLQHVESEARLRLATQWFDETLNILMKYTRKPYPTAMQTVAVQCSLAVPQPCATRGGVAMKERSEVEDEGKEVKIRRESAGELLGFTVADMRVKTVEHGTPAARCGLSTFQGMRLTKVDGHPVASPGDMRERLARCGLDFTLTLLPEPEGGSGSSSLEAVEEDLVIPEVGDVEAVEFSSDGVSYRFHAGSKAMLYTRNETEEPVSRLKYLPRTPTAPARGIVVNNSPPIPLPIGDTAWPVVVARLRGLARRYPEVVHNLPTTCAGTKAISTVNIQLASLDKVSQESAISTWLAQSAESGAAKSDPSN